VLPGIALFTVIVLSLGSVGILLMARGASHVSYGGPASGTRYTVTTSLMTDQSGRVVACWIYPLPMPPILCGGVTVTNVDIAAVPGTNTFANGTVRTPVVRLVGTWDGQALRLTEPPQLTKTAVTEFQPVTEPPPASSQKTQEQVVQEIARDIPDLAKRGIVVMQWGAGFDGFPDVRLAVADAASVQYLYDTYGRMHISGWLQPVNRESISMPTTIQLSAPSGQVVWALVGSSALFRSTDQGNTWVQRPMPSQGVGLPPSISFINDHEGWLLTTSSPETQCNAESVFIWHTTDAGATWQLQAANTIAGSGVADAQCKELISFVDPGHGFLTAWDDNHRPTIYRTSDGGRTWGASTVPDPPGFTTHGAGVVLRAGLVKGFGSILLVPAFSNQADGYVFRSTDGGASWAYLAPAGPVNNSPAFVTATRWVKVIAPDQSVETTDSGKTWHSFPSDYSQAAGVPPQVLFGDSLVGYATVRGEIQRTLDGGLHWVMIKNSWP
jgi:photosystem II stability/assembly factor-like uncharacterized protein